MKKFEEIKKDVKAHKKEVVIFGAGGVLLVGLGVVIGKKMATKEVWDFAHQVGDLVTDVKVITPKDAVKDITDIYKTIDEDIFTEVAPAIEETLVNNCLDTLHLERSWDVDTGIVKNLVVDVTTVVKE